LSFTPDSRRAPWHPAAQGLGCPPKWPEMVISLVSKLFLNRLGSATFCAVLKKKLSLLIASPEISLIANGKR
jgi:hypothetical protein